MFIINLNGFKRSGKDFAANILFEQLARAGFKVQKTSYAKKLREVAGALFNATPSDVDQFKEIEKTYYFQPDNWSMLAKLYDLPFRGWDDMTLKIEEQMRQVKCETFYSGQFRSEAIVCTGRTLLLIVGQAVRAAQADYWVRAVADAEYTPKTVLLVTDCRMTNEANISDYCIEIVNDKCESNGHATEQPLPRRLIDITVRNNMDKTFDMFLRTVGAHLIRRINLKFK